MLILSFCTFVGAKVVKKEQKYNVKLHENMLNVQLAEFGTDGDYTLLAQRKPLG